MGVGEKLKSLRLSKKKTLKEQGELFGVSLNSVYRWEHDLTMPKRSVLKKMAEYYKVPLLWLLQEGDEEEYIPKENIYLPPENSSEHRLLKMFRSLSENHKYKILGYVERIYIESLDEMNLAQAENGGE